MICCTRGNTHSHGFQIEGTPFNAVVGRCSAPVPAGAIASIILNSAIKTKWDKLFGQSRVVEKVDDTTGVSRMVSMKCSSDSPVMYVRS